MKVKELIAHLKNFHDEQEVYIEASRSFYRADFPFERQMTEKESRDMEVTPGQFVVVITND